MPDTTPAPIPTPAPTTADYAYRAVSQMLLESINREANKIAEVMLLQAEVTRLTEELRKAHAA